MLAQQGLTDPASAQATDEQFRDFWQFVQRGVSQSKLPDYRKFVEDIKAKLTSRSYNRKIRALLSSLRMPQYLFRFASISMFGDRLTRRIVKGWINRVVEKSAD
jgi:hypothetical protein